MADERPGGNEVRGANETRGDEKRGSEKRGSEKRGSEKRGNERRDGNEWLAANGGWILVAAGVALIALAACYSTRVAVAPIFAFTGIASIVFGILLPRIEGETEFSSTGVKMVIRGIRTTLAQEPRTPADIANIYEAGFDQLQVLVSSASGKGSPPAAPIDEDDEYDFSLGLRHAIPAPKPLIPNRSAVVAWLERNGWEVTEPTAGGDGTGDIVARRDERVLMVELRTRQTSAADVAAAALLLGDFALDTPEAVMVVPAFLLSPYARDQALAAADALTVYRYWKGNFEPLGPRDPVGTAKPQ